MAKRKHLPVLEAGKKYEGWMPFDLNGEPVFDNDAAYFYGQPRSAQLFATRAETFYATSLADVRRVTIIVESEPRPKKRSR